MKLLVKFDIDGDILDVPQEVIDHRDSYRSRFSKWIHDPKVNHGYWREFQDKNGQKITGLCFRGDAFVRWLNRKLPKSGQQAVLLESRVDPDRYQELPSIFF